MNRSPLLSVLRAFLVLAGTAGVVHAQTYIWTGQTSSQWTDSSNWAGGQVPPEDTDETRIVFGDHARTYVYYDEVYVNQLAFSGNTQSYYIEGYYDTTHLGNGGISYAPAVAVYSTLTGSVRLESSQTWDIQSGTFEVRDSISDSYYDESENSVSHNYSITKTGAGTLALGFNDEYYYGYNQWAGGLILNEGRVSISATMNYGYVDELDDYAYYPTTSFAAGTGTLTFNGGTLVAQASHYYGSDHDQAVILGNHIISNGLISTKNEVPLYLSASSNIEAMGAGIPGADAIELPVTDGLILAADTTIMSSGEPLYIESDITESGGARKLTIDSNGAVILTGDNSYAGGTLVNRGVLIFGDASSIPSNYLDSTSVGHLTAAADGYIGFGDSDQAGSVQAYFIDDFNKSSTAGTIGFDTDPQQAVPNIFTGSIDLTGFNATARLGSATRAILTGTLTPQGGAYRFGGGGGWLQVDAALTGARSLVLDSPAELPLTLRLTNTGNDFSGGTSVTRSGVIFADGAMPAGSRNVSVSSGGYVGTEGTDINGFLGRITTTATGIIGFDLAPNALSTRVISDTIDLSAFTTGVYLGTASAIYDESGETSGPGLRLTGTLTPGSDGNYRFAAYKGGALEVASALAGSTTQVYIGDPNSLGALGDPQRSEYSTVLLSGDNTFGGTTTFYTGQLMLGHDHALGTGALLVQPNNIVIPGDDKEPTPQLAAFGADRTIANAIQLNSDLAIAGDSQLTLTGVVAGTGELYVGEDGPTTLTLTGNNTFSGGLYLSSDSTVYLQHDHAAGTGTLGFGYSSSSGAIFETAAPVIHGLESDQYAYVELNASNAILEINQNINTTFSGELRADSNYPDNGRFLKTGTGTLRLDRMGSEGGGLYSYGFADVEEGPAISLDVQQGTLVLANGFYVEAGTVRVAGATLALENNVLYRPVIVGAGGRLAGNGDFTAPVSISAGAILAPGLAGQGGIGMLHFDHLELGGSGIYEWQVQALPSEDHLGADVINVYGGGTLVINATAESPFTIKIISLNSGGSGGVLTGLDPSHGRYAWTVFSYDYLSTTLLGNVFDPDAFVLDTSLFSSDAALGGSFTIFQEGNQIMLGFTPVPEPSTYALMALGLGFVVWSLRRRRA